MFSLSYAAAFDPYHTAFRFICAMNVLKSDSIEFEKLRIVDFYMSFPILLKDVSGSRKVSGFVSKRNKALKKYSPNPYEVLPMPRKLFDNMEHIQVAAKNALISEKIVSLTSAEGHKLTLKDYSVNSTFSDKIEDNITRNSDLISFLVNDLSQLDYLGAGGLKDKTKLGEYRYDDV